METDTAREPTGSEDVAWDLTDLYSSADDPQIGADLDAADAAADALDRDCRGRIASLSASELADVIARLEAILERSQRAGSFADLHWAQNAEDPARGALLQALTERGSRLSQKLVFLELELVHAPDAAADAWLADPALARYRHWIEVVRLYRPYMLSEAEEKILTEKAITGRNAWDRFFEEMHATIRFQLEGQDLVGDEVLARLYSPDQDRRRQAAAAYTAGLRKSRRAAAYVFNTILADKASDDRLRGYPSWLTSRNLSNQVDDRTVETLITSVTGRYDIVARYYRLKKRLLGLDELLDFDRYAPLPASERRCTWDEARRTVLDAFAAFHPRVAEVAGWFFDRRWIDAPARPGKIQGAFSHGTVPSVHPYILLSFQARPRDVMTLAHELGHGVHQTLARKQGMLLAHTPLTTAETASVFGEMLVFRALMRGEAHPRARLALLMSKIEDSFATTFRQVSMHCFENAIHNARRTEGELVPERFDELWLASQRAMFADSVTLTDDYGLWWSYIHHFIGTPGYVYAYAFGELLVLALYARYEADGPDFADAYVTMLEKGGSDWPHRIVSPLGVDLTDPSFWRGGLRLLEGLVDEADALADSLDGDGQLA